MLLCLKKENKLKTKQRREKKKKHFNRDVTFKSWSGKPYTGKAFFLEIWGLTKKCHTLR